MKGEVYTPKHLKPSQPLSYWNCTEGAPITIQSFWHDALLEHKERKTTVQAALAIKTEIEIALVDDSQQTKLETVPISPDEWGYQPTPKALKIQSCAVPIVGEHQPPSIQEQYAGSGNSTYGFVDGAASSRDICLFIG